LLKKIFLKNVWFLKNLSKTSHNLFCKMSNKTVVFEGGKCATLSDLVGYLKDFLAALELP